MKYKKLPELVADACVPPVFPVNLNEYHPKYLWHELWPKLCLKVVDGKLPNEIVNLLARATCTDQHVVEKEVCRRCALQTLKETNQKVEADQKANGIAAAVSEFLCKAMGKSRVLELRGFFKQRMLPKARYAMP